MESEWKRLLEEPVHAASDPGGGSSHPAAVALGAALGVAAAMAGKEPADFRPEKPCAALRADEPSACLDRETALSNAPASADGLITVPHALS